jgi:TatA/E family protein of Tat protein translocase
MNLISPVHLLFFAAIALIFLGPKRLPEVARALGVGMREFRDVLNGVPRRDPTGTLAEPDDDPLRPGAEGLAPPPAGPFA